MKPELENLIEMALADGEVTEKERAIILRKAEALGEDSDEVEMILDGKIALMLKEQNASQQQSKPKSNKEGTTKKCPSCGAPVESFNTKCQDCGHEFRDTEAAVTAQTISQEFSKIDKECRDEYFERGNDVMVTEATWLTKANRMVKPSALIEGEIGATVAERKTNFLSSFPIPNTKEDILEILALGIPEAKLELGLERFGHKGVMKKTWLAKCEQIIIKARFAMKEDKKTLEEIEHYAKQINV